MEAATVKKSVVLVGCGALGSIIADGITGGLGGCYTVNGVFDSDADKASALAERLGAAHLHTCGEIIALRPDIVVEAASKEAVAAMSEEILAAGIDMVILSVGALADGGLADRINGAGRRSGAKMYVASGAIGGFDLMRAAQIGGIERAEIHTRKNPRSLNGAPYLKGKDLPDSEEMLVFQGSAKEAIQGFPKNTNVSVAAALATTGVDSTFVKITSDPQSKTNSHEIHVNGEFGEISIKVAVNPSAGNPKSSALAGWSVLALLKKLSDTIVL